MRAVIVAAVLSSLTGCADWHAFLQCKYMPFTPCPPERAQEQR